MPLSEYSIPVLDLGEGCGHGSTGKRGQYKGKTSKKLDVIMSNFGSAVFLTHNKWLHPLLPSPCKQPVVLHTYDTIVYHRVRTLVAYWRLSCTSIDMYAVYRMWKMMLGHSPSAFPSLGSSTHGFTHMNIEPHIINTWRYSILYLLLSLANCRNRRR